MSSPYDHVSKVAPDLFQQTFGASIEKLDQLMAALLVIAFFANLVVHPVEAKHYMEE